MSSTELGYGSVGSIVDPKDIALLGSEKKAIAQGVSAAVVQVATVVEDIHQVIIANTHQAIGLGDRAPQKAQQAHVGGIYATIRGVARAAGFLAGAALERTTSPAATSVADTPTGAALVAGITCAFGDSMSKAGSALAMDMSVRVSGRDVPVQRAALRQAFPVARPRIVVFIHGLGGTEFGWGQQFSYADHLRHDLDISPVQIRYNTGLRIFEGGADFDLLMKALVREWPVEIESIDIVAHSMGALVVRSACAIAAQREPQDAPVRWLELLDNICYLAAPNHGSPVERLAAGAISTLGARAVSAPLARLANSRSAGIKDLRHGSISAADTAHGDADRREITDHEDLPLSPAAQHHFIAATVLPSHYGRLAHAVGDYLVQPTSALGNSASGAREPLTPDRVHSFTGRHHNDLLKDDDVYDVLLSALTA